MRRNPNPKFVFVAHLAKNIEAKKLFVMIWLVLVIHLWTSKVVPLFRRLRLPSPNFKQPERSVAETYCNSSDFFVYSPYKAILGVGFPLHTPYIQLI